MKDKYFRNRSVFKEYVFSYTIFLLLPIILLSLLLYGNAIKTLNDEIVNNTYNKIHRSKEVFDKKISEAMKTTLMVAENHYLTPGVISINDYLRNNAVNILKLQTKGNFNNIYLFYNDCEGIIGNEGWMSLETFFKSSLGVDEGDDIKKVREILESDQSNDIYQIYSKNSEKITNKLIIAHDIPLNSINPYGKVLFYLSGESLGYIFSEVLDNHDGSISLIKDDKTIYYEGIHNHREMDYTNESGVNVLKIDSEETGLSYVAVLSPKKYLKAVIDIRYKSLYVIFLTALLGVVFSFIFARRNYRPIEKIKSIMNQDALRVKSNNEFIDMENFIINSMAQNKNLKSKLEEQSEIIHEYALLKILKGEFLNDDELKEIMADYNIKFSHPLLNVIIFQMLNTHKAKVTTKEIIMVVGVILGKKYESDEYNIIHMAKGDIVVILNTIQSRASKNQIEEVANEIYVLLSNHAEIDMKVGIGRPYDSVYDLQKSYSEGIYVLENNYDPSIDILFYEELIDNGGDSIYWYPYEEITRMDHHLKQGNISNIGKSVTILTDSISKHKLSNSVKKTISFSLVNYMFQFINRFGLEEFVNDVEEMAAFNDFDDFNNKLMELSCNICNIIKERNDQNSRFNDALQNAIIEFLNNSFTNNSISLDLVAEKFDVSSKYLSRIFKEIAGYNFNDYITMLRINHAKKLLMTSDKPIKEIVEDIGYIDAVSFSKLFKKLEGISPSKYRELIKSK